MTKLINYIIFGFFILVGIILGIPWIIGWALQWPFAEYKKWTDRLVANKMAKDGTQN